jgi:hypothetical protein
MIYTHSYFIVYYIRFTPQQVQQRFSKLFIAIRRVPQVFVAVVQGPAVGAGMALALACDIRFVAPKAKFGVAMRKIGNTYATRILILIVFVCLLGWLVGCLASGKWLIYLSLSHS